MRASVRSERAIVTSVCDLSVAHEYLEWLIFSATMPKAKNKSLPEGDL